ncbi:hypothetical protein [Nonomuraea turkmeniaca]|uniref:hypothetical protein n=1 Tax=Nonomuraea turkmeniaca TaxID=103838 RepID=UPI0014775D62|nr:hypothetical protein [Nonomuraea turkmeniaca]
MPSDEGGPCLNVQIQKRTAATFLGTAVHSFVGEGAAAVEFEVDFCGLYVLWTDELSR